MATRDTDGRDDWAGLIDRALIGTTRNEKATGWYDA